VAQYTPLPGGSSAAVCEAISACLDLTPEAQWLGPRPTLNSCNSGTRSLTRIRIRIRTISLPGHMYYAIEVTTA